MKKIVLEVMEILDEARVCLAFTVRMRPDEPTTVIEDVSSFAKLFELMG